MEILDAKIEVGSKKDCFEINNKFRYTCIDLMMLVNILKNLFLLAIDYSDVFCSVVYIIFLFFFLLFLIALRLQLPVFFVLSTWKNGQRVQVVNYRLSKRKIPKLTLSPYWLNWKKNYQYLRAIFDHLNRTWITWVMIIEVLHLVFRHTRNSCHMLRSVYAIHYFHM